MSQMQPDAPPGATPHARYRVCFVTTEFHGLFRNGGIGTANTALARALNAAGFDVTVAFADADEAGPRAAQGGFAELRTRYAAEGLRLDFVPVDPATCADFSDPRGAALCVLAFVQRHDFEVVLFNDNGGLAYYTLLAARSRLLDPAPRCVVVAHGPVAWVAELNAVDYGGVRMMITAFLERECARFADVLVSPSRYMLEWMAGAGWPLPGHVRVIQNLIGVEPPPPRVPGVSAVPPITEIVFFGRLEVRKGVALFCDAIDQLRRSVSLAGVTVTFLGKFGMIAGNHSGVYIAERAHDWSHTVRLLTSLDQGEALAYLDHPGVLAVIASNVENAPCVVAECVLLGIPFLATDTGGTRELVAPEDHAASLFAPDAAVLAARLGQALREGRAAARAAVPPEQAHADWLDLVAALAREHRAARRAPPPRTARPMVTVCLAQAGPASTRCLAAVLRQTHQPLEVLVAGTAAMPDILAGLDLGSEAPDPAIDLRTVRVANPGRGAARNAAARAASGDFLLFLDETQVSPRVDCVARLLTSALALAADLVTALPNFSHHPGGGSTAAKGPGDAARFPVGGCLPAGLLENCFGGGAILVRRAIMDGDGLAFAEDCDAAILDWHFLAAANLRGHAIGVVPAPLFDAVMAAPRDHDAGETLRNHRRILALHGGLPLAALHPILEPLLDITRQWHDRLAVVSAMAGDAAAELARRLSRLDPASGEAHLVFCQYLLERHQPSLALDFALYNGVTDLATLIGGASAGNAALARQAIARRIDFWHDLDLSAELTRARLVDGPDTRMDAPTDVPGIAFTLGVELVIARVVGLCPPGTGRLRLRVHAEPPSENLEFALILCRPARRIRVAEDGGVTHDGGDDDGAWGWSGWIKRAAAAVEVAARVVPPVAEVLDAYLLARRGANGPAESSLVTWRDAIATLILSGPASAGAVERTTIATVVPRAVLDKGTLLTDVGDFALPVYVPGEPTLLHPVPRKIALVRLATAVSAGAHGVRCVVALGRPESHPVQFAIWLRPHLAGPLDPAALAADDALSTEPMGSQGGGGGWSGWFDVDEPMVRRQFTTLLPAPAETALDLYLATRVTGFDDTYFCHAHWHEIAVLRRAVAELTPILLSDSVPDQAAAAVEVRRNHSRARHGTSRSVTRNS